MAAKGHIGTSSAKVAKVIQRFRKHSRSFVAKSASKWVDKPALTYWTCCQQALASQAKVLGLTSDGTRMGRRDQLWTAITDPGRDISAWVPPAVCLSTRRELSEPVGKRGNKT
eukprot:10368150-Lingulodinium_polyedra.AAC.1